ncbi:hypothetical protein F5Y15DRAFT_209158 [Xylariaceae sp. FL0016]|nr:hypothetical protein F5Y15DRAFT_209158 [Xylariaceae sp. FL0016]
MDHKRGHQDQPGLEVMQEPEAPQVVHGPVIEKPFIVNTLEPPTPNEQYVEPYVEPYFEPPAASNQEAYAQNPYVQQPYTQQPYAQNVSFAEASYAPNVPPPATYPQPAQGVAHPYDWGTAPTETFGADTSMSLARPKRRILGLTVKTLWLVFGPMLALLLIGLAVGLGVALGTG